MLVSAIVGLILYDLDSRTHMTSDLIMLKLILVRIQFVTMNLLVSLFSYIIRLSLLSNSLHSLDMPQK